MSRVQNKSTPEKVTQDVAVPTEVVTKEKKVKKEDARKVKKEDTELPKEKKVKKDDVPKVKKDDVPKVKKDDADAPKEKKVKKDVSNEKNMGVVVTELKTTEPELVVDSPTGSEFDALLNQVQSVSLQLS